MALPVEERRQAWNSDPGLALVMFAEIQHHYGWQPFKELIGFFERDENASKRPQQDDAKVAAIVERFSLSCGHDLRPLFHRWGFNPTLSPEQNTSLSGLPLHADDRSH